MQTDLKSFIERVGDPKAAKLIGVKERTVASWRRGERTPRTKHIKKIQKAAKAAGYDISLESIFGFAQQAEARP